MIEPTDITSLDWYSIMNENQARTDYAPKFSPSSKYNLNDLNNEEAIGY